MKLRNYNENAFKTYIIHLGKNLQNTMDIIIYKWTLLASCKLVLNETYIFHNNSYYQKIKGFQQGCPACNCLANIYLYFYENDNYYFI
ncbi:UNVERIFIED_CONTAM: hypothetical protein NCL1_44429 [Trichonephila clavipes]